MSLLALLYHFTNVKGILLNWSPEQWWWSIRWRLQPQSPKCIQPEKKIKKVIIVDEGQRQHQTKKVPGRLMRSNRPQVKIHFKVNSNCLLIDFFDPIQAIQFTRRDDSIRFRTIYIKNSLIHIKNRSNLIKNGLKRTYFIILAVVFDMNWLLIDFYNLLINFFDLLIKMDQI